MNRLRTPAVPSTLKSPPVEADRAAQIESGALASLACDWPSMVFAPIHYEPNYAYPLVVWLHGDGTNERQLMRLMPQISLRNYVAVAPRGTVPVGAAANVATFTWSGEAEESAPAEQYVFEAIDAVTRRYHVARRRVFLAGADAGGTTALRIALAYPDRFAGALSFGGPFPNGGTPLSRLDDARRLPLFMAYDGDAGEFAEQRVDEQIRLFYTAGMQVMLRRYPPRSLLGKQMLADADRWMMELVTGAARRG
jgi:phospholipase/carboxylesterase